MKRLHRILAFVLSLVLLISLIPTDLAVNIVAITGKAADDDQSGAGAVISNVEEETITVLANDTKIHRSKNGMKAPALESGEYKLETVTSNMTYDRDNANRKVKPCLYNFRELMTNKIGTSNDKGIDRYPYVVIKVNVKTAGYYDLGVRMNMRADATVNTAAIIVDGIMHVVRLEKPYTTKQTPVVENVYLTQGEHYILYMSVIPQNENEVTGENKYCYPWANFWGFTFNGAKDSLEVLDASSLTGTDVENIVKESTRVEAEDTKYTTWNIYNKTETNTSASGDTVVGGPSYGKCQQSFDELTTDGLDKAKIPYVQYVVEAPAAGTYYITVGANPGTSNNSANPVPFVAVIANDEAPVKAQLDGAWGKFDSVTVAVQLKKGLNVIRCTSATKGQYAAGSSAWVNLDYFDVQKGLTVRPLTVGAADDHWKDYLYANRYADKGDFFGGPNYADLWWDYPSLYEDMLGVYSDTMPAKADRWPYIAFQVDAAEAGEYQISARFGANENAKTIAMIVDGALHVADVTTTSDDVTKSVYLSQGKHVIIFTSPMPRDLELAEGYVKEDNVRYPYMDFYTFSVTEGLSIVEKPTLEVIQKSMQNYSRIEAEDFFYVSANGNYAANISKAYIRRYDSPYTATVKGAAGAVIDGTVAADEKQVNTTQTYADLQAGSLDKSLTSYVQYTVIASQAGTYTIRVGAYLEGSGTAPYGTILVNGKAYQAQFADNWNGYDVVNLPVELKAGENTIQCIGITADQTAFDGWIGYDFIDIPNTASTEDGREVSASDENWDKYLYLNRYQDKGANFGGPNYNDMKWDYPSLYEKMLGIYSDEKPDRAGYWPYIAFNVTAQEAGYYRIAAVTETAGAKTFGVIVDGAVYVVNATSNEVTASVYLTEGKHTVIFTAPMPRDMELVPNKDDAMYPWMNFCSFKVEAGLNFADKPTEADIKAVMTGYTRIEAEDFSYVIANGNYAAEISKAYSRRYNSSYIVKVMGAAGAAIDGTVTADEKKANSAQTYADLQAGGLDAGLTSYVQYTVIAPQAGTYMIRVGAYLEGSGTMPYGTILVNGTAYKAQFSGNWNGYDAANLPVELREGENTILCIGVTADQTATDGWIGYDFIDVSSGAKLEDGRKEVSASNDDWDDYLHLNLYADCGGKFADPGSNTIYPDMQWDHPSLYEKMYGIYSDEKPDRAGYWPYIAFRVAAEEAGYYRISASVATNEYGKTVGMIVDGAVYAVDVTLNEVTKSVYLTEGEHIIIFTSPIPLDMEHMEGEAKQLYPWMDYHSFKVDAGLNFADKPTEADIQAAMTAYSRIEAEDVVYVTYNANYGAYTTKKYNPRYGNAFTAIVGANGAVIDGTVSTEDLKANASQTFAELIQGLDAAATSYVAYSVNAEEAGVYMIRIGAYLEGSGTVPYGTVLVNGTAYKVQFSGNWNGYEAVNLLVELQEGENTIQCVGVTADQTDVNAWIGYDYLDVPSELSVNETGATLVNAGDEGYVTINRHEDKGDTLGGGNYNDLRWDRLSIDILNYAYLYRIPYMAVQVTAEKDGVYDIYFTSAHNPEATSNQIAILVDGVTSHPVAVSEFRSHASIYLTKGAHTLVFTTPMPADMEAAAATAKLDKQAYPWIDMKTVILGTGLTVEKAPNKSRVENPNVAIEVEKHAIPNMTLIKADGVGAGTYLKAQTADQIIKNGIDPMVTPYVEYRIEASEAGNYTVYIALSSGSSANMKADQMKCSIVIENGDTRQVKSLYSHADTQGVVRVIPVTLSLEKGINVVRVTHFTRDSVQNKGYMWNDFDYIEMSPETAKKLNFLPVSVLEAEDSTYTSYQEQMSNAMSGGAYLGKGDYGYIDANRITFEALDVENLDDLARVTYLFEAEKAGTYTISVKFRVGMINYKPEELEKIGIAMIVNGKDKQLVEFSIDTLDASISRTITVDLVEGENEITFTATLADYMQAVSPKIESEYRLVWVDHDALYLSHGLSMGRETEKFGVEDSSVGREQLTVQGIKGETDDTDDTDDTDQTGGFAADLMIGIGVGAAALVLLCVILIILAKKKKQAKNK